MDKLISLNAALSAIGEWIAHREYDYTNATEYLRNRIKAIPPAEPCEDAISRQAVLDCFKKWQPYMATRLHEFERELSDLPSVKPQPKTGHWIERPRGFKCSKCLIVHSHTSIFCPSCGAKMIEPQERSEE